MTRFYPALKIKCFGTVVVGFTGWWGWSGLTGQSQRRPSLCAVYNEV